MSPLSLIKLEVKRQHKTLLHPLTAKLPGQGLIGVIGPNGAGKSTLLQALAGILPHRGHKMLGDHWPNTDQIGFLPQEFSVRSRLSVAECILLGRREQLGWRLNDRDLKEVEQVLARFALSHLANQRMDQLSGGQQQLVLLAQRLSRRPRLLILDEPTSALDLHHQLEVLTHLKHYCQQHQALIITSLHDLNLAARFADYLVLLDKGQMCLADKPSVVLQENHLNPVYRITAEIVMTASGNPVIVPQRLANASTALA
ncbi:ABC transporter ATP-binding protein [Nitrincola sp.]|uniref:ABC transporter ATP-binding protein n=1 Tax=Nitrincola sp. TaxID=1926584 RepID=UPI003A8E7DC6